MTVAAGGVLIAGLGDAGLAACEAFAEPLDAVVGCALFFVMVPSVTSAFSFAALFFLAIERVGSATGLCSAFFDVIRGAFSATDSFTVGTCAVLSNGVLAGQFVSLTLKL